MAQDLKGKKTRLGDDADIYKKREELSEKQKWKELDRAGKITYFRDYYLMKLIVGVAGVIFVASIIWSSIHSNGGYDLYVAIMSGLVSEEEQAALTEEMQKRLAEAGVEKSSVLLDSNFPVSALSVQKLQVYVASGELDVIMTREETFYGMAGYGYFRDLTEVLSEEELEEYHDRLLEAAGAGDQRSDSLEEEYRGGDGEVAPYGLSVGETGWIASVSVSTKSQDNAHLFLKMLADETGFDAIPTAVDPTVFGDPFPESTESTEEG